MFDKRQVSVALPNRWRRVRELTFATCTVWLVLQNVAVIALVAWGHPASALAAGTSIARTAISGERAAVHADAGGCTRARACGVAGA